MRNESMKGWFFQVQASREKQLLSLSLIQDTSICWEQGVLCLACSLSSARQMLSQILESECISTVQTAKWDTKNIS